MVYYIASDQYALAVAIYELTGGRLPFEINTVVALLNKRLNEMSTSLSELRPDVPNALSAVGDRALAKQPEERYPTMQDFAAAFEGAVKGAEGPSTNMFSFVLKHRASATKNVHTAAGPLGTSTSDVTRVEPSKPIPLIQPQKPALRNWNSSSRRLIKCCSICTAAVSSWV